jgi:hypothetical protein
MSEDLATVMPLGKIVPFPAFFSRNHTNREATNGKFCPDKNDQEGICRLELPSNGL